MTHDHTDGEPKRSAIDHYGGWREEFDKHHPSHYPTFDPLRCVWCYRIYMVEQNRRQHDFPPKHIYEPVKI